MKTSILIAVIALSLTAVLAAPQKNGFSGHKIRTTKLKHFLLPKNLTYPPTLPELIELSVVAIGEVTAAIDNAVKSLEGLLAGTSIIDPVLGLVAAARTEAFRLIGEALAQALQSTADEFGTLVENLIGKLAILLTELHNELEYYVGGENGELMTGVDDIIEQLANDAAEALSPIVCSFYPPDYC
jgi:hypothetical protein